MENIYLVEAYEGAIKSFKSDGLQDLIKYLIEEDLSDIAYMYEAQQEDTEGDVHFINCEELLDDYYKGEAYNDLSIY